MKISFVDRNAVLGESFFHHISSESKVLTACLLVLTVIWTARIEVLAPLFFLLSLILVLTGTGFRRQAIFLVYPLFFSSLFGWVLLGYTENLLAVLFFRSCSAVFVLLLLITTTPYVEIFSVLGRVLPAVLVDIMFLTYRSFFLLAEQLQETLTAVRLKGGYHYSGFSRSVKNAAQVLGFTLIKAMEMNEKNFRILLLRGYEGGLIPVKQRFTWCVRDVLPVVLSLLILIVVVLL